MISPAVMTFRCEHVIADAGGLARTNLPELNAVQRRNINSARGYCPPIGLAARRLVVGRSRDLEPDHPAPGD